MTSFVYAISNGTSIKIGKANSPHQRLKELQTGSSVPLKIIALIKCHDSSEALRIETALHRHFEEVNAHLEWFKIDVEEAVRLFKLAQDCIGFTYDEATDVPRKPRSHSPFRSQSVRPIPNLEISPLMLQVVAWLESNPDAVHLSSRTIAERFTLETGKSVSHIWVLTAKHYWEKQHSAAQTESPQCPSNIWTRVRNLLV